MVPQHILQQLCISKVDDPEDGSKALVSDSGASRWAVHLIQDPKQSFDKALCQLRVLLHQLGTCILSTNLLVTPWRQMVNRSGLFPQPHCDCQSSAVTQWRSCVIHIRYTHVHNWKRHSNRLTAQSLLEQRLQMLLCKKKTDINLSKCEKY